MLKLLYCLYVATVAACATLWVFCVLDQKIGGGLMFPHPQPNGWTWALWITMTIVIAPWAFAAITVAVTAALRATVGIPSEMQP